MPASTSELLGLFDLMRLSETTFSAPGPQHSALAKAYGGQYISQALLACDLDVDDVTRVPHAIHGTFLAAGAAASDAEVEVSTLRDGRSFSMRRAQVQQGGRVMFDATVSFHKPELGYAHAMLPPLAPPPEECPSMADAIDLTGGLGSQMWRDEWPVLDMRYAGGATNEDWSVRSDVPTSQRFWVKTRDSLPDDTRLHRTMIAYFSDFSVLSASLLPHGHFVSALEVPRASLNHSMWIHDDARADDWVLCDQSSAWAGHGRGHGMQRIYARDGRLVATVAQEGLIRQTPQ